MSRIDDVIAGRCAEGVTFVPLGSLGRRNKGTSMTASRMKIIQDSSGPVRVFAGGQTVADVAEDAVPATSIVRDPSIIVKSRGHIGFTYYEKPFTHKAELWSYSIQRPDVDQKFVYYYLLTLIPRLQDVARATSVKLPQLGVKDTDTLPIPVPPLDVQREIVKILDQFTQLEAELEAELEARRRQYEHYRARVLVASGAPAASVTIGGLCRVSRGQVMSKDYLRDHNGPYPVYSSQTQNSGIFGRIDSYACDEESLTWTTDGANAGSIFYHVNEKFSITNVCGLLRVIDPNRISTRYLYYQLRELAPKAVSAGMGNPKLMAGPMSRIAVPVPSMETQLKIVASLDFFDALVNSLSVGLPAELRARRKQYEYYRGKLLTFKETD